MATNMFLERTFDPCRSVAAVLTVIRDTGWCFAIHKVDWRGSFLATDGSAMICWFLAPDAESARVALRQSGADTRILWGGIVHEGREPAVPNVVVARSFAEPVTLQDIQSLEDAGAACLRAHHVKFARRFFSADRKRMLCFYEAPDVESVRLAQREAAMPLDAAWAFERIGPESLSSEAGRWSRLRLRT